MFCVDEIILIYQQPCCCGAVVHGRHLPAIFRRWANTFFMTALDAAPQ